MEFSLQKLSIVFNCPFCPLPLDFITFCLVNILVRNKGKYISMNMTHSPDPYLLTDLRKQAICGSDTPNPQGGRRPSVQCVWDLFRPSILWCIWALPLLWGLILSSLVPMDPEALLEFLFHLFTVKSCGKAFFFLKGHTEGLGLAIMQLLYVNRQSFSISFKSLVFQAMWYLSTCF